ncbi:MAG: DEAD/DEAH box helicase [Methylococcaceae bacterium]|nr:DEAD/DEAH box helicase [Methylococcaceae bacterium]MCI0732938.1 DEAD/DEAH box helicase [Methylococcaceae bacterium]
MPIEEPKLQGFKHLSLAETVLRALNDVGYETPSPIQAQAIPPLLAGRDVLGQAQTGTGKTAAFACPLLSRLEVDRLEPQVLVLVPTRELAIQVAEAFQRYAAHIKGFHVIPIYGGQEYRSQIRQLKRGVHVVVGTPGRVMDHMRRGTLILDGLNALVLDEADEMLRMGFIDDVEWILEQTPANRQTALFSATLPESIRRIAEKHLNQPESITVKVKTRTPDTIRQRYWMVSGTHKLDALTRILEAESFDGMIVFVRTRNATVELAEKLEARGYASAALNGDIPQKQREQTVDRLKSGRLDILVATDVAARGLDVDRISHVINYDIPYDSEAYIHRIGRTGRTGRKGEAILFIAPREKRLLKVIEQATRQKIDTMELPSTELINDKRIDRFAQRITDALANEELEFYQQLLENYQREHNVPAIEIAAALAKLLQGDEPLLLKSKADQSQRKEKEENPSQADKRQAPEKSRARGTRPYRTERFRIEVGQHHGVKAGNIVRILIDEAGLDNQYIGQIDIQEKFTTVDLPEGMPKEVFRGLKKARIAGLPLNISRIDSFADATPAKKIAKPRKRFSETKKAGGKSG